MCIIDLILVKSVGVDSKVNRLTHERRVILCQFMGIKLKSDFGRRRRH